MKRHFSDFWPGYVMLAFLFIAIGIFGTASVHDSREQRRCLKAGYHYVNRECYKTIIPAEWEK